MIDGTNPVTMLKTRLNLLTRVTNLVCRYADRIVNAPSSYKKVLGQKVPQVWELKKEFTNQLVELGELAVLAQDHEVLDLIKMQAISPDEVAVKENVAKINNLDIPS